MTKVNQLADFSDKKVFVGIDVHKESWSVSLFYEQVYVRTISQPPSVDALEKFLSRNFPGATYICGYESGFSGFWIHRQFSQKGINCYVIHAADIPKTQKRKTAKTDRIDSRSIAQALSVGSVSSIYIPDPQTESHRSIIRYRKRLVSDIQRCKHRIRSLLLQFGYEVPDRFGKSWSNKFLQWLKNFNIEESITRITLDHMIEELELLRSCFLKVNRNIRRLQSCEKYKSPMKSLLSIPGIGPLTAITLLTEIVDIKRFASFRQLNSFVGLYPMEFSSGEHEHKGNITIRHNKYLRYLIVEAAWIAIRNDPALLMAYEEWKHRMTGKRAIIKVARKLLSRVRYVWLNETSYVKGIVK